MPVAATTIPNDHRPVPRYPQYDPKNPEKSFNNLVRQLELRDNYINELLTLLLT